MDTRSALLHHALALFAARGYDAVGVQEVVFAAGVTKPTLYHHFGSKRGLLETLVHEGFAPLFARLDQVEVVNGDVPETLRRVVRVYFGFATRQQALYRLLLAMALVPPENEAAQVTAAITAAQRERFTALFVAFAAYNGNLRERQQLLAGAFAGVINSFIAMALNDELALDEAAVRQVVQLFVYGIYS